MRYSFIQHQSLYIAIIFILLSFFCLLLGVLFYWFCHGSIYSSIQDLVMAWHQCSRCQCCACIFATPEVHAVTAQCTWGLVMCHAGISCTCCSQTMSKLCDCVLGSTQDPHVVKKEGVQRTPVFLDDDTHTCIICVM